MCVLFLCARHYLLVEVVNQRKVEGGGRGRFVCFVFLCLRACIGRRFLVSWQQAFFCVRMLEGVLSVSAGVFYRYRVDALCLLLPSRVVPL